ncbi:kelch repeat-containing protein, partial [Mammaliicoccus sciuri]|uniref:kelch repeat-containing protein n=1 Tax=Mammaliicoccus sciuri TaxID=1296 RepID=UPI001954011B
ERLDLMLSEQYILPLEAETSLLPLSPAEIIEPPPPLPKIYSYQYNTSTLHWTDLATQEQGTRTLTDFTFQQGSSLCEVPGDLLFVTGGNSRKQELVSIDLRSIAVTKSHNPMLTARGYHCSIYFEDFLYVLGGYNSTYTQKCERYDLQQNRWSEVAPLPVVRGVNSEGYLCVRRVNDTQINSP